MKRLIIAVAALGIAAPVVAQAAPAVQTAPISSGAKTYKASSQKTTIKKSASSAVKKNKVSSKKKAKPRTKRIGVNKNYNR
ncbi:hypothetical protein P8H26_02940 [Pseudochrobactrum sp. sp1633]|uniref:hypothetical protein n=1 Tax=Pseudochrobactrum sp. sp1633 TaxID=3036706 RepID=UPI0025A61C76|nr:hypothetical protein [Pseudochrobactrum sp. sp1633]MDM8344345.1 hypothetical protein [Pseudochrobactrum sp. sp1633]HWD14523.1 hypothetical protein [Pseudochrobactrum sp.]